jgi:hypothetical protein
MKLILLILSAVNALSLDQAANQISASLQKILPYSTRLQFYSNVQSTIMNHYDVFLDIKNPSKQDLISAVKDATQDLQIKSIRILSKRLPKRDLKIGDQIALDLSHRKEYLLGNNDNYQKISNQELDLQNAAFDQQAADFENFLDSLDTNEHLSDEPLLDLVWKTAQVQLEKDTVENDILGNDEELYELHQELVKVDPKNNYLQLEKNSQLETLQRQLSSARIILANAYRRIGISEKTWDDLQKLANRMDQLLTSNPSYTVEQESPVSAELEKILKSSPNSGSLPIVITMTVLLGVAAPPILFAMFSTPHHESFELNEVNE